jgi:hypothetical protein
MFIETFLLKLEYLFLTISHSLILQNIHMQNSLVLIIKYIFHSQ